MKHARPIIPPEAREKVVRRHEKGFKQAAMYYLDRKLVGHRSWDDQGKLAVEYAIRNKVQHGLFRVYHSNGTVNWVTNFVDGKEHGISRQYDENGKLIGTYRMRQGTGVDLWYSAPGELSEERHIRDGKWNGFERWWNSDYTVWEIGSDNPPVMGMIITETWQLSDGGKVLKMLRKLEPTDKTIPIRLADVTYSFAESSEATPSTHAA